MRLPCFAVAMAMLAGCASSGNGGAQSASSCVPPTIVNGGLTGPSRAPASCVRAVESSSVSTRKFGTHTVGDVVTFNVPAGTGSITIFSQSAGATTDSIDYKGMTIGNTVVATGLKDPGGTILYDDSASPPEDPSGQTVYYGSDSVSTGVMTLPNSGEAGRSGGGHVAVRRQ